MIDRPASVRLLAGLIGVAIASTVALAGCSDGDAGPHASPSAHRTGAPPTPHASPTTDAAEYFSILRRPVTAADALPETELAPAPDDMVPNSARFAVEHDGTKYWIATVADGGACLIAWNRDRDSPENYSVCGGGQDLEPASVITSMIDEQEHQTLLVSDGYTSGEPDPLHELAPNVWVSAPGD
ncbi:hypothetical protein [Curtobacterium sp. VKM Ac-1393]|uniref:hypothetical protein n=1 Tax=Curtobacterium sp. VKM Ac-1393 TaxID=2783814 RepID=UPI001889CEC0|nr:hypothetical protein [Curtobacterium sp. VKM Ac-1393]MBF4606757.1 hypothetical protein [Curtobacterium sp. VKM Ac-1393]